MHGMDGIRHQCCANTSNLSAKTQTLTCYIKRLSKQRFAHCVVQMMVITVLTDRTFGAVYLLVLLVLVVLVDCLRSHILQDTIISQIMFSWTFQVSLIFCR